MRWIAWTLFSLLLRAIATQQEHNATLVVRNGVLAAEVRSLKEGREAIEERARQELQMTRGDEVLFQMVRPEAGRADPTPTAEATPGR
jgi:cell division protein FtsB